MCSSYISCQIYNQINKSNNWNELSAQINKGDIKTKNLNIQMLDASVQNELILHSYTIINDSKIKIYALDYTDENLLESYNETIIDGKLVFKKEEKIFLINDVLYYRSQKYLTFKLEDKFKNIDNEINELNTILDNNFMIKFIRLYKYSEMNDLVFNKIRNSDFKINGLIFWPTITGKHYIYINDQEFEKLKTSNDYIVESIAYIYLVNLLIFLIVVH